MEILRQLLIKMSGKEVFHKLTAKQMSALYGGAELTRDIFVTDVCF